jgi:hypothetical protein
MERATIAVFLTIAAVIAIAMKAPPKVYENVRTYYKTLIQAPAAQVTAYTSRPAKPEATPKPPVAQPAAKMPEPTSGPNITVLGGISWDRDSHASRARVTPAAAAENEAPASTPSEEVANGDPVMKSEEQLSQNQ